MPDWRIVSPAPRVAVMGLAGQAARVRRLVLAQTRAADSLAIYRGDEEMAVAFLGRHGWRRLELAIAVSAAARPHMRRLVRIAHLTLCGAAETHIIVARVHPANEAGRRMARAVGFLPARLQQPGIWIFRRKTDGKSSQPRQGSPQGAGGKPAHPGGGQ